MKRMWWPKEDLYGPTHLFNGASKKLLLKLLPKLLSIFCISSAAKFFPKKNESELTSILFLICSMPTFDLSSELFSEEK